MSHKCFWCKKTIVSIPYWVGRRPFHDEEHYRQWLQGAVYKPFSPFLIIWLAICIIVIALASRYAFGRESPLWDDSPYAAAISAAENGNGQRCCDIADGVQVTDPIIKNGHYTFVYQGKEWVVEDWMLVVNEKNPLGHALAWFYPDGVLRCFWPPVEI